MTCCTYPGTSPGETESALRELTGADAAIVVTHVLRTSDDTKECRDAGAGFVGSGSEQAPPKRLRPLAHLGHGGMAYLARGATSGQRRRGAAIRTSLYSTTRP